MLLELAKNVFLPMVRVVTSLIIILLLPVLASAQVQRMVLVEEFTNASSNPCAVQNPGLDALLLNNPGKVATVKYHVNWPGSDPFNLQNPNDAKTRAKYYSITGVPYVKLNGSTLSGQNYSGAPANLNQEKIDALSGIPSPFFLTVTHRKSADNDSLYVTLKVKATQAVSGNLSAHIAIEEKTIEFLQPPGSNGEKVFNSVLRKMLPDAYGTQLPYSFNPLDSLIIEENWALKDITDPNLICVVAWIQDNYIKEIHQAAYDPPRGPDLINVSPVSIDQPGSISCGNVISPKVTIRNLGGNPVTSMEIDYSVNNNNFQTYFWTGNLQYLDQKTIALPSVAFNPLAENNNIVVFTHNPNGTHDSIPADDTMTKLFHPAYTAGTPVTLELQTDQYPSETTWKLINSSGNIVASGGPYTQANTMETRTLAFSSGECYEFIINDQFGDGICCNYGNGFYKLKDHNGVVFAQGGSFAQEEITPFMVDINLGVPEPELSCDFQVFPNPFDNTATISLYLPRDMNVTLMVMNEVGQFVYMNDKVLLKSGNHTFDLNGETWTPGIYFVKIFAGDKLITRKLSLTK